MIPQIKAQLEQSEARTRELQATFDTERTSLLAECTKLEAKYKRGKAVKGEAEYLAKRVEALEATGSRVLAEKDRQIELLNKAKRGEFEKMHGLLAYAAATGGMSTEAQVLYGSLDDFLKAKNDSDRKSAERSVFLCFEHGALTKGDKKPDTSVLDEYEALEDEDASAFYRQHEATIKAQYQARIDAAKQP